MAASVQGVLDPLAKRVEIRSHHLITDEPEAEGGHDSGPTPHEFLDAALASCTALTLNMYIKRKNWPARSVRVEVDHAEEQGGFRFRRRIHVEGDLSGDQHRRLLAIAEKCPVHKVLAGPITIESQTV